MYNILIFIAIGIFIGFRLRQRKVLLSKIERLIQYSLWILLFLFGLSIGGNQIILDNFPGLGFQALVISSGAMVGSILCIYLINKIILIHEK